MFAEFEGYCESRDLSAMPAEVQTVLAFIGHLVSERRGRLLPRYLAAIRHEHVSHGLLSPTDHPTVSHTRKGTAHLMAELQPRVAKWRLPFRTAFLRQALVSLDLSEPWVLQLFACLAFGLRIGQRPGTLGNLRLEDVHFRPEHLAVYLARTKTDQEGQGRWLFIDYPSSAIASPLHPAVLLRRHIAVNSIRDGFLFRSWRRGAAMSERPLGQPGVDALVKFVCYDTLHLQGYYAGHSIRIGAGTMMAEAGMEDHVIRQTCGWKGPYAATYLRFAKPRLSIDTALGFG